MILRLLWKFLLAALTFEFYDAWLILLVLWIHIRYPHEILTVEDPDEEESGGRP